ncbi:MAG TPA: PA14 domain-containing protein [Chloroflexota bacterium]|nr:PA14 domain-containing protein [Chloroflexota bacterium]
MIRRLLGPVLVAAIVVISGWTDVDRYFNKQMHDAAVFAEYSAGPTFAGHEMAALPAGTRVVMDERLTGEPTIQFLAPDAPKPEGYEPYKLPLTTVSDTALFLGGDQTADADYIRKLYPDATIKTFSPPYGGPILLAEALVGQADVAAIQGLNVEYQPSGGTAPVQAKVPSFGASQPPLATPYEADFTGSLAAPAYGDYGFRVDGAAGLELLIDRQAVASDGQPVQVSLARGVHHIELRAAVTDAHQPVRVLWRPPSTQELVSIPPTNLFSIAAAENGLLGRYYPNATWTGPPGLEEIDPFVSAYYQITPLPMPFSVVWTGQIAAPIAGVYRFNATSIDSSEIFLDGSAAPKEAPLSLTAGLHDVRIRYEAHSGHNHVEFRWQPPGRNWEVVPSTFLFPSKGVGAAQPMPELPAATTANSQVGAPAPQPAKLLTPVWQIDLGAGSLPVGVALDRGGNIYVADAGRHTLSKLDANGNVLWTANPPARTAGFQQLAAVAVATDGTALVLDGDSGIVSRFTPDGRYAGAVAKDLALYHPRGLAVAGNGDIYIADTGGSRVLHLSAAGRQLGAIGVRGSGRGGLDQPTGVVATAAGDVAVVDPAAQKVVRFAASGGAAEWSFGAGPTVNGPQMALGANDTLWISDTTAASLQAFSSNGQPLGRYTPDGGLNQPSGLAVGDGYVVVAEPGARRVRKLTTS